MTAAAHEPVVSGPHQIRDVDGRPPSDLDDFVGEHHFTAERGSSRQLIEGRGVLRGAGVRFHQKGGATTDGGPAAGGKDIRVWRIDERDGEFAAEPEAAI